jgi:hypothetical protein
MIEREPREKEVDVYFFCEKRGNWKEGRAEVIIYAQPCSFQLTLIGNFTFPDIVPMNIHV